MCSFRCKISRCRCCILVELMCRGVLSGFSQADVVVVGLVVVAVGVDVSVVVVVIVVYKLSASAQHTNITEIRKSESATQAKG
jgi:hypothetical protein